MTTTTVPWVQLDTGGHDRLKELFGIVHHDVHRRLDAHRITCIDIPTDGDGLYRVFPDGRILHNPDIC